MSGWSWFWLAWAVVGIGVETWAIKRKASGDTLSEQMWSIRKLAKQHKLNALFSVVMLGFFVWLALHFAFHFS